MSKNTNRKGLALGAMFSLVASLFVGATPASANASDAAFFINPEAGTSFNTLVTEDFALVVTRNTAVVSAADFESKLKYSITTDRGMSYSMEVLALTLSPSVDIEVSASGTTAAATPAQQIFYNGVALDAFSTDFATHTTKTLILNSISAVIDGTFQARAATQAFVVKPASVSDAVSNKVGMVLHSSNATGGVLYSGSPTVTVTFTAFLDMDGSNTHEAASEPYKTVTIKFLRYADVTRAINVGAIDVGGTFATASASVTNLNLNQQKGKWGLKFDQYGPVGNIVGVEFGANPEITLTEALNTAGRLSASVTIQPASAANTVSAQLVYFPSGITNASGEAVGGGATGYALWPVASSATVTVGGSSTIAGVSGTDQLYAVRGSNANPTGHFRPNSLITVRYSVSQTVASSEVPVTFTFNNPTLSTEKTISIDGGTAVTSLTASALVKNTNTSGVASFTILTAGFVAGDVITVSAKVSGLAIRTITLTAQSPTYTITPDSTTVATTPGGSATLGYVVTDQYRERVSGSSFRLKLVWTAGYNGTATTSFTSALANGVASAALTHAPATFTGSGTVRATLQTFSTANNLWSDGTATADTTVIVTNNTNSFRQGLLATYSASISYGADFTWSATINRAFVLITGSSVVATGTGLIFRDMVESKTASDTIRLQSNGDGNVQFQVTARKAGTYTVTLTAGTATTTTLVTIDDAAESAGSNIAFDLSSMTSGKAAIITGTLTDVNGNPVDTTAGSGGANIQLTVTGTGAAFVGSLTSETNAAGKFSVALLSGAGDVGTVTITAVYFPRSGAAAADRVTKVHSVSVVAAAAPEVNAVIGSFNGRWAVRVENAKGSVVSVKAGNRWVKFSALNNNYLYSMRSVKGRTIAVSVWVDGELQNSQTITIK